VAFAVVAAQPHAATFAAIMGEGADSLVGVGRHCLPETCAGPAASRGPLAAPPLTGSKPPTSAASSTARMLREGCRKTVTARRTRHPQQLMCHDDQVVRGGVAALVEGPEDDARPVEELAGPTECAASLSTP
jgi:hypothetical protein